MATVLGGAASGGINFDQLDLGALGYGQVVQATATFIQLSTPGAQGGTFLDSFFGAFTYDQAGALSGGTLNRFQETFNGGLVFDVLDANVSVPTFLAWVRAGDDATALRTILAGADSIAGTGFADRLYGYDGADTISGGAGADVIDGGAGASYLRGDEGDDRITGGAGFDDINGNTGDDTANGGAGDDWVVGGKDRDLLSGGDGADVIYGNLGDDTCEGGAGGDIMRGGQENDSMTGGDGNDWISGDRGGDTLSGGSGADIFHTFNLAGLDRVLDFNRAAGDQVMVDPGTTYTVSQVGLDVVIDMGGGNQMVLVNTPIATLSDGWIFTGL
ncbi:MAG: calcium-binding protein [Phenylobacterium sp.]|uniref:calcium-binding protein n=1 Tax=Phenylobacterium sp. TaxID=1871053 RepID=UPI0027341317|nr:calcium-binding protein [Phenylobacterium sp.]MDP3174514.1 calcium-binding protein [Phenylobacterium sp.]